MCAGEEIIVISRMGIPVEIVNSFSVRTLLKSLPSRAFISRATSAFLPQLNECIRCSASIPMATGLMV